MARPASRSPTPLPPRMQRLLREARALLGGFAALLLAAILLTPFRHLDEHPRADGRQRWFRLGGFGLLLLASTGVEWLRAWHWTVALPDTHGGALGGGGGAAAGGGGGGGRGV